MTYKRYIESQTAGRKLMLAIRTALEALDSKDILKCKEWLNGLRQ